MMPREVPGGIVRRWYCYNPHCRYPFHETRWCPEQMSTGAAAPPSPPSPPGQDHEPTLWELRAERLRRAARQSSEGGDDSDVVHQVIANAELSQLRRHRKVVARLVALLPPKLRATYLVGASDAHQRFWIEVFAGLPR